MRSLGKIIAAVLLLFLSTAPSMADIISAKIRSDTRHMILFSEFEYSHTGDVSVAVSSVGITSNSSQTDPSRIGFFLLSNEFADRYDLEVKQNPDLCALDIKFITVLFTFGNLSSHAHSSYNESYHVTYPGLYSLYLSNCNNLSLTMDVRAELYNTDNDGTTKDYLSAAQPQPSLYLRFFLIYLCFLGFWIKLCFKNQQCVQMIHLVMGMLLLTTLVYFVCAAANQQDLKVAGTHHSLYVYVMFHIYQLMRNVLFFAVILLIGIGWCFWNRILPERDISFLAIITLLQFVNVTLGEPGPYIVDRVDVEGMSTALDVACCFAVFLSTLVAVTMELREATRDTKTYLRSYSSLKETSANPYVFLVLLIVYLFIRGLQFHALNIPREFTVAQETTTLVFSMVIFYMYRPFLDGEDEKGAGFLAHTGV